MRYTSPGRKEIKRLANQLQILLKKGLDHKTAQVQLLIYKIKGLLKQRSYSQRYLRRALGAAALVLGMGFSSNVNAQAAFTTPVQNPFNLDSTYYIAFTATADLDNDGDADLLVGESYGNLQYFENTGNSTSPSFAAPVQNPFSLTASGLGNWAEPSFVDLDGDGDLDLLISELQYNATTYSNNSSLRYFENIGTSSVPNFTTPLINPFGLPTLNNAAVLCEFADLDNDGDFDIMMSEYNLTTYAVQLKYYANTGSATTPAFGTAQTNPFGLSLTSTTDIGFIDFVDLDGDGDLDLFFGESNTNGNFEYFMNTGTATTPSFAAPAINPFGLTSMQTVNPNFYINSLSLVDLDGDSDLDIISGTNYGVLTYFENVFISSGPLSIANINLSSPSCNPGGDGTISAVASGGIQPIIYKIGTDSNTTGSFTNLSPGTYTLRVRDSLNTIIDSVITLAAPIPPAWDSLNSFVGNVSCNGLNDGLFVIAATSGTPPYTYQLFPSFPAASANSFYTNLGANTYTFVITDAKNCVDSGNVVITEPPAINFGVDSTTNLTCSGAMNGAIYTTATGGNGGFNYTISPIAGFQNPPGDFTNLPAGSYSITASDINGCSANVVQTVTQPASTIVITPSNVTNVSCFGGNDGSFTATASGSTGFTYSISPNVGAQAPAGTFNNLTANSYSVTASDANNCSASIVQNITQPPALTLNITSTQGASTGLSDGSITSVASGGTPTYTYTITPNMGAQAPPGTFTGLTSGNYTITATDANNCSTTINSMVGFVTNVTDIEKHNIKIYPNPVVDVLKLESDIEITKLTVLDITGKTIKQFNQPQESISLNELPQGIYILELSLKNEETVYTRITKQ